MRTRKVAIAGLASALVLLALGGGAVWAPSAVRARLTAAAAARGCEAEIGAVSFGVSSLALEGVRVHAGPGAALELRADEVRIAQSPLLLALRGVRALDAVSVHGLSLRVRVDATTRALVDRLRGNAGAAGGGDADARDPPRVRVDGLSLALSDAKGALLQAKGSFQTTASGWSLGLDSARVGAAPEAELALSGVRLEGAGVRTLQLTRGAVASASLRLAVDAAPEAAGAPVASDTATTRDRVLAVWTALQGATPPARGASTPPGDEDAGGWLEHLDPTATFALRGARVVAADGAPILAALDAKASRSGDDSLRWSGTGKASGAGTLGWDLTLWPKALRADGHVELRSLPLSLVAPLLPALPWHAPEGARIDAKLRVKSESLDRIAFDGEVTLRGASIASPRIAPEPVVGIDVEARGRGRWFPLARRIEIEEGALALGKAAAGLAGVVELASDHYLFDVQAKLPPTSCTDAVRSIPAELLGDMRHARWAGKIEGGLRVNVDSRNLSATELDFDVEDHCEFLEVPVMADLRRFHEPFVHSVVEPDDTMFEMETGPGTPEWTKLDDISPFFVHAVLSHEDAQFFSHHGFSPAHIESALARNLEAGRYVVGASTITMQLVKNVFLRREKTLARKIQEVLLTWWIERVMTKRDILELYLNVIEYGPGVYGIRQGARHYFNRLPSELSPAEAVYLSTILPSPKRYHTHFERRTLPPAWRDRMRPIFERMRERGWYSPEAVAYGVAELGRFRFVPEGTVTEAREIPGAAKPLPGDGDAALADWDDAAEPVEIGRGDVEDDADDARREQGAPSLEDGTERSHAAPAPAPVGGAAAPREDAP